MVIVGQNFSILCNAFGNSGLRMCSSYCGSGRLLPRGRSSPTTCCITALIGMKATGKINKRAQRKWFFFFLQKKRPCSVLAVLENLSCSLLFLLLTSASSAPSSPFSFPSHWSGHVKIQLMPALIRCYGNAAFSLSPALTWKVVKNVDGCHQRSVKKKPWCWKRESSERLLYPDVLSFSSPSPCGWIVLFFFTLFFFKSVVPDGSIPQTLTFICTDSRSCHSLHTKLKH